MSGAAQVSSQGPSRPLKPLRNQSTTTRPAGLPLAESSIVLSNRVEDVNDLTPGHSATGMNRMGRDDPHITWSENAHLTINRQLEVPVYDVADLFMGMGVLRQDGPRLNPPMGEGHGAGVHKSYLKARNEFTDLDFIQFYERHSTALPTGTQIVTCFAAPRISLGLNTPSIAVECQSRARSCNSGQDRFVYRTICQTETPSQWRLAEPSWCSAERPICPPSGPIVSSPMPSEDS